MIEQYTITTTPKYNFPHPTTDTTLPQRLIELSIHSLKTAVNNNPFQLNQQTTQQPFNNSQSPNIKLKPIPLHPKHDATTVAAIDTSSMKIGETATGILIAIRGATVWKQNSSYRYLRIGPFMFHITEENKIEVYNALQMAYSKTQIENQHQNLQNHQIPTRLANLLEKWLQTTLSKTLTDGIILFDGSLTAGTPDTPTSLMKEILNNARTRGNVALAFSKMTTLRVNGLLITDLSIEHKPPYILEAEGLRTNPPTTMLGEVYIAKLTRGNCAFRLDIDKEVPAEQRIEAVERLLGNDLLAQGYPETLRLAHILCTFTANEVIAMQHFATRNYGLKLVNRPNMHKLLFGPFGKGENAL
ncbi:MAG: DNA double-strand break repair nuclease NurA [Candidatus Bathycorpusculaceae bacterium]